MQSPFGTGIVSREWDSGFEAGGVTFKVVTENYHAYKTTQEEVVILKRLILLRLYDLVFPSLPRPTLLEVGVFEGGSALFFALAYPHIKIVGVDIKMPDEAVLRRIHDLGLSDRVKIHYETSQTDADKLGKILAEDFNGEEIGMIIDDASHDYALSRRTFEILFGHLAPGGSYCLEDWSWAHWGEPFQTQQWVDKPALSNLAFEMLMLLPSVRGLIESIDVKRQFVRVIKGLMKIDQLNLNQMIMMRGKKLSHI